MNARIKIKLPAEHKSELHRQQTAGTLGKRNAPLDRFKSNNPSIALHRKPRLQNRLLPIEIAVDAGIIRLCSNFELSNLLIRWDFRHIHQIKNLNRLFADRDLRIVIDAEIPHRVREAAR